MVLIGHLRRLTGSFNSGNGSSVLLADSEQRKRMLKGGWQEARYVALDLETDGLEPDKHRILAAGWVPLSPPWIELKQADYGVVRSTQPLSQSAVIHGLSEQDLRHGEPLAKVLRRLARWLDGAVLVAHHAPFDWEFLRRAFAQENIPCQPLALLDTLRLEQKRLSRHKDWLERNELTLAACRQRYELPAMQQHHALSDAVACAELFLAQAYAYSGAQKTSLKQLLRQA